LNTTWHHAGGVKVQSSYLVEHIECADDSIIHVLDDGSRVLEGHSEGARGEMGQIVK